MEKKDELLSSTRRKAEEKEIRLHASETENKVLRQNMERLDATFTAK